ncbi:MAG: hypothetical protein IT200_11530 [Thermoleophilia bacterium]|nr:hypothetical protein [Thermoleophilia bacterium]
MTTRVRIPATLLVSAALAAAVPAAAQAPAPPWAPGCTLFPAENVWNAPVRDLPVRADSDRLIAAIGLDAGLHPDFSDAGRYGIPFNVITKRTRRVRVRFDYAAESDRVAYPIPARPRIEGGSDRHILMVDRDRCRLYELFAARRQGGRWRAGSGATWDLRSNRLRPAGWTSADAAGLPILPGLVRYDEAARGVIRHALRFTAPRTRNTFIYPARHQAGVADASLPPMGLRVRLKRSVSLAGFGPQARIVLTALRDYGMILADNGSPWYVTGAPNAGWDDDDLHALGRITGADLEVVDTSGLRSTG